MKKINLYFLTIISFVLFIVLLFCLPGICVEENIIIQTDDGVYLLPDGLTAKVPEMMYG